MQNIMKIVIDQNGNTEIEVINTNGSGCKKITENLEKALGDVKQDKTKPEFYQNKNNNTLKNGI